MFNAIRGNCAILKFNSYANRDTNVSLGTFVPTMHMKLGLVPS